MPRKIFKSAKDRRSEKVSSKKIHEKKIFRIPELPRRNLDCISGKNTLFYLFSIVLDKHIIYYNVLRQIGDSWCEIKNIGKLGSWSGGTLTKQK